MEEYRSAQRTPASTTTTRREFLVPRGPVGSRRSESRRDTLREASFLAFITTPTLSAAFFAQIISRMSTETKSDFENLREKFDRFGILIVGRANAGKTTILRGICNTTENPEIYDGNGKRVCIQVDIYRRVYAKPRD